MHKRSAPEKCAIKPSIVLTAHLHMSSVAHLQKSDKKVGDFTSHINQCAVVSGNNSSLTQAKILLIYGLTVAQQQNQITHSSIQTSKPG